MLDQTISILRSAWSVWVMVFFCGIVLWAYVLTPKAKIEAHGQIPLRDDENEER